MDAADIHRVRSSTNVYVWCVCVCVCVSERVHPKLWWQLFSHNPPFVVAAVVEFGWNENCELSMNILWVAIVRLVRVRYSVIRFTALVEIYVRAHICMCVMCWCGCGVCVCAREWVICECHFHSYILHQRCEKDSNNTTIIITINSNTNQHPEQQQQKFAIFIFIMDEDGNVSLESRWLLFQVLCTYSLCRTLCISWKGVGMKWAIGRRGRGG